MIIEPTWIDLAGVVNMRDLGGRESRDGRVVAPRLILRSDNLQDLPEQSIRTLLDDYHVTDVVDLRTEMEVDHSGPSPLTPLVKTHHLSLYPSEQSVVTGRQNDEIDEDSPWDNRVESDEELAAHYEAVARHYVQYFEMRPDSLLAAMRVVLQAQGAVIVNCAAGKDRTGVTSALILSALDIPHEQIVADYAASSERIGAILDRLGVKASVGSLDSSMDIAKQSTVPVIMERTLAIMDERYGGMTQWLKDHGWAEDEQRQLEDTLLTDKME